MGVLPIPILTANPPTREIYLYGAMTRQPWRIKFTNNHGKIQKVTSLGDCVYVKHS